MTINYAFIPNDPINSTANIKLFLKAYCMFLFVVLFHCFRYMSFWKIQIPKFILHLHFNNTFSTLNFNL